MKDTKALDCCLRVLQNGFDKDFEECMIKDCKDCPRHSEVKNPKTNCMAVDCLVENAKLELNELKGE